MRQDSERDWGCCIIVLYYCLTSSWGVIRCTCTVLLFSRKYGVLYGVRMRREGAALKEAGAAGVDSFGASSVQESPRHRRIQPS